jgi:DNA topoisomerase-1
MVNLVIVESPAKCKKISSYLGPEFTTIASAGHIRALKASLTALGTYPEYTPTYEFIKTKSHIIKNLLSSARKCKDSNGTIYIASDDDREGEAIAYSIALLLKLPIHSYSSRIVFHEITEGAVKKSLKSPRAIDMSRVYSQQTRAMLDLLIGFTVSPSLWKPLGKGLSGGRCQTPALRILVDRENEIASNTQSNTQSSTHTPQEELSLEGEWETVIPSSTPSSTPSPTPPQ